MFWTLLFATAWGATCPERLPNSALAETIAEAEQRFAAGQVAAFQQAAAHAHEALPCVRDPLTPTLAGAWHRLNAMELLVDPSPDHQRRAVAALRAMLQDDPTYVLPASLQGNLFSTYLEEARRAGPAPTASMATPDGALIYVDGRVSEDRPFDVPLVVQLQWRQDPVVCATVPLSERQAMPEWGALGLLPPPAPRRLSRPVTLALSGGAVALTAASGGAFGWGLANRATFLDHSTPDEDLPTLIDRSHALTAVSAGAAVGALVLGGTALVWGEF